MNRASKIAACLVAATVLLPASAEARRRFGGSSSVTAPAAPTMKTSRGMVIVPVLGASRARASTDASQRAPFPPASAQQQLEQAPSLLRLTSSEGPPAWCRSEVVVGGFCILN